MAELMYNIYSREHNMWWRPNAMGYTWNQSDAGQYDEATARSICDDAGEMENGLGPSEFMIPVVDWSGGQQKENDR